jgi:formylglycine-generating enzyme required for sulfatase activity
MAALGTASDQGIAVDGLASCVATEKVREPVITGPVDGPRSGTFGGEGTCSGADNQAADAVRDARICVPSGALVLGDRRLLVTPSIASTPERTFHLSRFAIDAHEASVARFRAALARGFVPPSMPLSLEGTIGTSATDTCSWSKEPRDREGLAITCLTWATARAYCKFQGGDLTSEAQWEYVATIGKGAFKTDYPWGDEPPSCDRAVYERLSGHYEQCLASGAGPRPVDSLTNDVNPLGVMGLAGNVSEWVRDSFEEYGSACWSNAPVTDPVCEGRPGFRVLRGGSWASPPLYTRAAIRQGHEDYGTLSFEGVRCAYPMP